MRGLIQITLATLQRQLGKRLAYDLKTDTVYIVEPDNDGGLLLYSLTDGTVLQWTQSTTDKDLIFAPETNVLGTGINGKNQGLNRGQSGFNQDLNSETIRIETGFNQEKSGEKQGKNSGQTSLKRKKIAEYYGLVDFSVFYEGFLRELSKDIYQMILHILSNTHKQSVIDKVLEYYERAKVLAEKGKAKDINELRKIRQSLQGIINRQNGINKAKEKMELKEKRKRLKIFLGIALFTALLLFYGYKRIIRTFASERQTKQVQTVVTTDQASVFVGTLEGGVFVIAGSYRNKASAINEARRYQDLGFEPKVIESNGLYRVAIEQFSTVGQAKKHLASLKKETSNYRLWILNLNQ